MANISWPSVPSGTSNVGLGAGDVRRVKKVLTVGLGQSANFMDRVNPVKQGAAPVETKAGLPLFDSSDATIVWQYQYKPVIDSQTSRMYSWASVGAAGGFSSQGTFVTNGPAFIDQRVLSRNGSEVTQPDHVTWVELYGSVSYTTTGTQGVSFGLTASPSGFQFEGIPAVFLTTSTGSAPGPALTRKPVHLSEVSVGGFTFTQSSGGMTTSDTTVLWWAYGYTKGAI